MESKGKTLWSNFKKSLVDNIKITELKVLEHNLRSKSDRTRFYKKQLFPKICTDLGLIYGEREYLTVDAGFYKVGNSGYHIPIVLIESENDADSTENEVYKLSCLHAPLKVLFICLDWNDDKFAALTTGFWDYIIGDFLEEKQFNGFFGVVVVECLDAIKFHAFGYDETGKITDLNQVIFEIES